MLRHLGTFCPVGQETSSGILEIYPSPFAMSRILKVTSLFLGGLRRFGLNLGILEQMFANFGPILAKFDHIFTAIVSRIWINGPGAQ